MRRIVAPTWYIIRYVSDLLKELETQRRSEERAEARGELSKLAIGAELGVVAGIAIIRVIGEPSSLADFAPALGGIVPGTMIAAATMSFREHHPEPLQKQAWLATKYLGHEIITLCQEVNEAIRKPRSS
jgi:hypothetical protein